MKVEKKNKRANIGTNESGSMVSVAALINLMILTSMAVWLAVKKLRTNYTINSNDCRQS